MNKFLLEEIRKLKREIMPEHRLILFGSQARGDARPDSDWDLLVLLNNKTNANANDDDQYGYPFAKLGWAHGRYFSAKVFGASEWEQQSFTPFYKNVQQDGIEIL